jgi:hypothetical protein
MAERFSELPGWLFETTEVSVGVYKTLGRDEAGRSVEAMGLEPEALIQKCRQAAVRMMTTAASASTGPSKRTTKDNSTAP